MTGPFHYGPRRSVYSFRGRLPALKPTPCEESSCGGKLFLRRSFPWNTAILGARSAEKPHRMKAALSPPQGACSESTIRGRRRHRCCALGFTGNPVHRGCWCRQPPLPQPDLHPTVRSPTPSHTSLHPPSGGASPDGFTRNMHSRPGTRTTNRRTWSPLSTHVDTLVDTTQMAR